MKSRSKKSKPSNHSKNNSKTTLLSFQSKKAKNFIQKKFGQKKKIFQNQIFKKSVKIVKKPKHHGSSKLKTLSKESLMKLLPQKKTRNIDLKFEWKKKSHIFKTTTSGKSEKNIMKQIGNLLQSRKHSSKRCKSFDTGKSKNFLKKDTTEIKKGKLFRNRKKNKNKKKGGNNPFMKKIRKNSVYLGNCNKRKNSNQKTSKSSRLLRGKFSKPNPSVMDFSGGLFKTKNSKSQNFFFNKKEKEKNSKHHYVMKEKNKMRRKLKKKKKKRILKQESSTVQISKKIQQMKSAVVIQKAWRCYLNRKTGRREDEEDIKKLETDPDIVSQLSRRDGVNRIPDLEIIENFQSSKQNFEKLKKSGKNFFLKKTERVLVNEEYFVNKPLRDFEHDNKGHFTRNYEEEMEPVCMKSTPRTSVEKLKREDKVIVKSSKKKNKRGTKKTDFGKKMKNLKKKIKKKNVKEKGKNITNLKRKISGNCLKPVKANRIIEDLENFAKNQISKWRSYLKKLDIMDEEVLNESKAQKIKKNGILSIKILKETMGTLIPSHMKNSLQKTTSYLSQGIRKESSNTKKSENSQKKELKEILSSQPQIQKIKNECNNNIKFKQEKWIHPKRNTLRVINKYISSRKATMRSLSVKASTVSAVFSRSKSIMSPEQDSIFFKKNGKKLKKSLRKGFIYMEEPSCNTLEDQKSKNLYISYLIENEIKSLGNRSNLEPISGRLGRRSKNGSSNLRMSRNKNFEIVKNDSIELNNEKSVTSLNLSKDEFMTGNIVQKAIERRRSENLRVGKMDEYELKSGKRANLDDGESRRLKKIIDGISIKEMGKGEISPIYFEKTPEKVSKNNEGGQKKSKVRSPIGKMEKIKNFEEEEVDISKELRNEGGSGKNKEKKHIDEFTTPETKKTKEVPFMIEKGVRRGGYINIRNALNMNDLEILDEESIKSEEKIENSSSIKTQKLSIVEESQLEEDQIVSIQVFSSEKKNSPEKKTEISSSTKDYVESLAEALLDALITECLHEHPINQKLKISSNQLISEISTLSDFEKIINYLKCLFTAINEQPHVQRKIHKNMNKSIGPNNLQKIKLCSPPLLPFNLHHQKETTNESMEADIFEYSPILSIELYIQMEEIMKQSVYIDENLTREEVERRHILHKLVYDCLNEVLDYKRVYGLEGLPFKFLTGSGKEEYISTKKCATILENVRQEILDFSCYRAGILPEKEPGLVEMEGLDAVEVLREEIFKRMLKDFVNYFLF